MLTMPPAVADRFTRLFWPQVDAAGEVCAIIEDYAPPGRIPDGPIDAPGLTPAQRLYLFHLAQQMVERNQVAIAATDEFFAHLAG